MLSGARETIYSDHIRKRVRTVIRLCEDACEYGMIEEKSINFVKELSNYLTCKLTQPRCHDIVERSILIHKMLNRIIDEDLDQQLELLDENNISRFKGLSSQILYHILVDHREVLERQKYYHRFEL